MKEQKSEHHKSIYYRFPLTIHIYVWKERQLCILINFYIVIIIMIII